MQKGVRVALINRFTLSVALVVLTIGLALGFTHMQSKPKRAEAAPNPTAQSSTDSKLMSIRALGDPNAPVKISEHSSLTCSHCGVFQPDVFELGLGYIGSKGRLWSLL